jgi:hypothetical protein
MRAGFCSGHMGRAERLTPDPALPKTACAAGLPGPPLLRRHYPCLAHSHDHPPAYRSTPLLLLCHLMLLPLQVAAVALQQRCCCFVALVHETLPQRCQLCVSAPGCQVEEGGPALLA